jgi:hypothetical protein
MADPLPVVPKSTPLLSDSGTLNRVWILFLEQLIKLASQGNSGSGSGASSGLLDVTATAATSITATAGTTDGDMLTVRIKQDATGGWAITWDAIFNTFGLELATAANTTTIVNFIWIQGDAKWVRSGVALTGMS